MAAYHCQVCLAAYRLDVSHCPRDGGPLDGGDDPLIGVLLGERYQVEALLGEGGMARVYRVLHVGLHKTFALKAIFGDLAIDPRMAARFELEARAASRLDHPHIVSTVDFAATPEGLLFLVLEYLDGQDLGHLLLERGPLPPSEAFRYFRQMMHGIAHAHGRGLVHRDLKPDNLFLIPRDDGSHLKIVDFGLAHLMDSGSDENDRMTRAGEIFGTPEFMAPEQVRGGEITAQTDLYATGIILYQMLCGRTPFASDNPTDTLLKQVTAIPPPLGKGGAGLDVPAGVDALIANLLAKAPQDRPASAAAVLERTAGIEALLHGAPAALGRTVSPPSRTISVPPPRTISGPRPRVSPSRAWVAVLGAVISAASVAFFLHAATRPQASAAIAASSPGAESVAYSPAAALEPALEPRAGPPPPATEPAARRRANDKRWVQRGEALLVAKGLSMADLALEPRLDRLWSDLHVASGRGDALEADRVLERIGDGMTGFDYPRVLLRKKIARLYAHIDGPTAPPGAGLLRALLDAEAAGLREALGSRERRGDVWAAVTALEKQADLPRPAR